MTPKNISKKIESALIRIFFNPVTKPEPAVIVEFKADSLVKIQFTPVISSLKDNFFTDYS